MDGPLASFRQNRKRSPHGKMGEPHTRFRLTLEKYLARARCGQLTKQRLPLLKKKSQGASHAPLILETTN